MQIPPPPYAAPQHTKNTAVPVKFTRLISRSTQLHSNHKEAILLRDAVLSSKRRVKFEKEFFPARHSPKSSLNQLNER
ncbi:MAG: hypothetical protein IT427_02660 [Pirellulales bacterium]|nr:hypothetical protein [Pirellulales bacterium]